MIERGPNVNRDQDFGNGILLHVTNSNSGNYEFYYASGPEQSHVFIFQCNFIGSMVSNLAFDRDYGWAYVICQNMLIRLDVATLVEDQVTIYVDDSGALTDSPAAEMLMRMYLKWG